MTRRISTSASLLRLLIGAFSAIACGADPADADPADADPADVAPSANPDIAPTTQTIRENSPPKNQGDAAALAWENLYKLRGSTGEVLLFDRTITEALATDLARLAKALREAAAHRTQFDQTHKIILQNDVWGLFVRLESATESSHGRAELSEAAGDLVRDLSLEAGSFRDFLTPPLPIKLLSEDAGWHEVASELPALNHELAYGSRRIFRLFRRVRLIRQRASNDLALASHLVALDRDGTARRSDVIGEVEILHFNDGELTSAEVYKLDRLGNTGPTLQSLAQVVQIPGEGADSLIAEFDPPEAMTELPCLRCHHDGEAMSLPNPALDPRWRDAGVLLRAQQSTTNLWPGLAPGGRSRR